MGSFVLTNVRLLAVGANLSSHSNKVEISTEVQDKDTTNYKSEGWTEVIGGLASAEISGEGQWEAGDPGMVDDASWAQLGGVGPWSIGPTGAAAGDLAYLTKALRSEYALGEGVGEVAPWTSAVKSSWPLVRGVFEHSPGVARTAGGSSAGQELGALAARQRMYAALHVLSVAGTTPSLAVTVESAPDNTFAAPTTRLTFDAAAAAGGQILRTDGTAVTDTWWRVSWAITGTTPSFLFAVSLGAY